MSSTAPVYRPDLWDAVATLFLGLDRLELETIGPYLSKRADRLLDGWLTGSDGAVVIVASWHPELISDRRAITAHQPTTEDAKLTIAREHGFKTWAEVEAATDRPFNVGFETAVDHLLAGRLAALKRVLDDHPDVVAQRSPFGHRATLLHYIAANGVETERQVTPLNAAELITVLREAGADASAVMDVYGGQFTTLQLAETSAHPHDAGVLADMVRALSA